jgi:hypothetical protein
MSLSLDTGFTMASTRGRILPRVSGDILLQDGGPFLEHIMGPRSPVVLLERLRESNALWTGAPGDVSAEHCARVHSRPTPGDAHDHTGDCHSGQRSISVH